MDQENDRSIVSIAERVSSGVHLACCSNKNRADLPYKEQVSLAHTFHPASPTFSTSPLKCAWFPHPSLSA
uniref:Uncharacterized protein n=1 Tax=Steinernema glaseri TaxID=37863 RepID=A0A1I7Y429_9BILA